MDEVAPSATQAPPIALPQEVNVSELHAEALPKLLERAQQLGVRFNPDRSRHSLIFDLLKAYADRQVRVSGEGVLELTPENYGFIRWPRYSFKPCPEDVYVAAAHVKRFHLKNGNLIGGKLRSPREKEKFLALEEVTSIEGAPAEAWSEKKDFEHLTP